MTGAVLVDPVLIVVPVFVIVAPVVTVQLIVLPVLVVPLRRFVYIVSLSFT
jgi:hypothetical protein